MFTRGSSSRRCEYMWAWFTMGRKRKQPNDEVDDNECPSKKKTKHKRKKTKNGANSKQQADADTSASIKPLTLKIRLGNEVVTADTSDTTSIDEEESMNTADVSSNSITDSKQNDWEGSDDISVGEVEDGYQTTPPDDVVDELIEEEPLEEEDDEGVWLDALETGNVDERGYVPQKKDPSSMTVRQRAIFGSKEVELLELPLSNKRGVADEEETQEMLLKKTERNKKRRIQAIKRREKHKAETVQKLLQKQTRKNKEKKIHKTVVGPHLKYINNSSGITISLTEGLEYPIIPTRIKTDPYCVAYCSVCTTNTKKYNDSKTNQPLCSLECYNKLKSINQ